MTLTFNFQGQIWNLLYLSQRCSDCHETKGKYIDWTFGLICDHPVWPCPWPWPWIFKVKHGICYISAKMVRLPRNNKQTYLMNSRPQMWPIGLTLAVTLIFEFSRSNVAYTCWPYAWRWPRIFLIKFPNNFISEWEGRMTLNKGVGTRSLMTMTVTILWPRSGERIYQILSGVTSDVGMPSTRLVP